MLEKGNKVVNVKGIEQKLEGIEIKELPVEKVLID
jgi:hypothetical protein